MFPCGESIDDGKIEVGAF